MREKARSRRSKRDDRTNGNRQYFRAVNRLRRNELDQWQLKNDPEKFKKRLAQLTLQAKKRQYKQEQRDKANA